MDRLPKLKSQVQGDAVRVSGKNKDDLQTAIQLLRKTEQERDWPVPLQFVNTGSERGGGQPTRPPLQLAVRLR